MFHGKLYPYQQEGVEAVQRFRGRALIGDEPGLGKTAQALGWLDKYGPRDGITVVVCPASLKENWAREIKRFLRRSSTILEGRETPYGDEAPTLPDGIYILNYDILGKSLTSNTWLRLLSQQNLKVVIGDEVQALQNSTSNRTKGMRHLCANVPNVLFLSGTPFTNEPYGLFPILNILRPDMFYNQRSFGMRYCGPARRPWGWEFKRASNTEELSQILTRNLMIRRRKADVIKDLPPKTRSIVPLELDASSEYLQAERDFITWLGRIDPSKVAAALRAEKLVKMGRLIQLAAEGKMKAAIAWTREMLVNCPDAKFIGFAVNHAVLRTLVEAFPGQCVVVTGKTPPNKREALRDRFRNDPKIRLYFGNIKATGSGWNGQVASHVIMYQFGWVPADILQCEDRAHRLGQKSATNCWYLPALETVETRICEILQKKQEYSDRIIDGHSDVSEYDLFDRVTQLLKEKADNEKTKPRGKAKATTNSQRHRRPLHPVSG